MRGLAWGAAVAALVMAALPTVAQAARAHPSGLPGYRCALTRHSGAIGVDGVGACQAANGAPASGAVTSRFFIADIAGGRFECRSGNTQLPDRVHGEDCVRTR